MRRSRRAGRRADSSPRRTSSLDCRDDCAEPRVRRSRPAHGCRVANRSLHHPRVVHRRSSRLDASRKWRTRGEPIDVAPLALIRTVTVGPGFPPSRRPIVWARTFAGCHRRSGVAPAPQGVEFCFDTHATAAALHGQVDRSADRRLSRRDPSDRGRAERCRTGLAPEPLLELGPARSVDQDRRPLTVRQVLLAPADERDQGR